MVAYLNICFCLLLFFYGFNKNDSKPLLLHIYKVKKVRSTLCVGAQYVNSQSPIFSHYCVLFQIYITWKNNGWRFWRLTVLLIIHYFFLKTKKLDNGENIFPCYWQTSTKWLRFVNKCRHLNWLFCGVYFTVKWNVSYSGAFIKLPRSDQF